jgi:diguanylate cyclase
VLRDHWVLGLVGYGLLCSVVTLLDMGGIAFMVRFAWITQVPLDAAFCWFSWRASRVPGIDRVASRYMVALAFAAVLFLLGDVVQVVLVVVDPRVDWLNGSAAQSLCFLVGCSVLVYRMLRHPVPASGRSQSVRFYLDAVTVLAGGAVLIWSFSIDPTATARVEWVGTLLAASILLVTTFASIKLVLSGNSPMTRGAAIPMIASAAVLGVSMFLTPSSADLAERPELLVLRVIPSVLIAIGPRIQELQTRVNPVFNRRRRARPYNLLPYLAIAVTFVVLVLVLPHQIGIRVWGVVVGAVVVTAMVVVRQLLALFDNFDLIKRLDATLLELRGHQRLLHEQATHDGLTRLVNRTAFGDAVTAELSGGAPALAVLLIDLDDFKTVNDTLGHGAGDDLLVTVAERLRGAVREHDLVARLGGDEFAVLLRDVSPADAGRMAARILADVVRPMQIGDHTLVIRASIGVAPASIGDDIDGLMRNADIAMYAAKDAGKGGFQQYVPDMAARIRETAELGTRLREAVGSDQFSLVYQPIVDLETGAVTGAEALVRWHPPGRGVIAPAEFVPAAERTGLIVPLGRWILREACAELARWRRLAPAARELVMSVNVSGRQLQEPGFVDEVATALADCGLPADRLMIEVTETAVLDSGDVTDALHALRGLGVGLALDDFGTAASSLGLLLTCPVSALKLDRSFVDRLGTDSRQRAVATAVIQMARALDLGATAEGVEVAEQADLLRGLGYRHAQGYLFSTPVSGVDFAHRWQPVPAGL